MPVEGAQVLKALKKVAGAAGLPSDFNVKFTTKGESSGIDFVSKQKEVLIGGGSLFTEAPVPADNFDILVGLMLHEVGHYIIETSHLTGGHSSITALAEGELFQTFMNIGEDIVVEEMMRSNSNLADYERALSTWAISKMREAQPHKLLELWIEYSLGHKSDRLFNIIPELEEAMHRLVELDKWLRQAGLRAGPSNRLEAYLNCWDMVKDAILTMPEPPKSSAPTQTPVTPPDDKPDDEPDEPKITTGMSTSQNDDTKEDEPDDDEDEDDNGAGTNTDTDDDSKDDNLKPPLTHTPEDNIGDELAKAIEDAVQSDSEDITEQVDKELDGIGGVRQLPVIRSRETKTPMIKPDFLLCKRLERIMTIRKRLQSRTMYGEQYGKIDKCQLHRVSTDGRIFNLKYKFPDGFPDTKILIDLSGSMSGRQADEVLQAAGALQTLVNAEVWCYYNTGTKVDLIRVDDGKLVHQHEPTGNTPSGLAIVGVSLGMKRGGLIIHLTDGEHNCSLPPWNANWIIKPRGIELVNLIWGRETKHYDYDGMNWRQLSGLAEFPDALYQILVEQVNLNKMGGKP